LVFTLLRCFAYRQSKNQKVAVEAFRLCPKGFLLATKGSLPFGKSQRAAKQALWPFGFYLLAFAFPIGKVKTKVKEW
jgi:hypothetical protein